VLFWLPSLLIVNLACCCREGWAIGFFAYLVSSSSLILFGKKMGLLCYNSNRGVAIIQILILVVMLYIIFAEGPLLDWQQINVVVPWINTHYYHIWSADCLLKVISYLFAMLCSALL
jgi:hypothetical protein